MPLSSNPNYDYSIVIRFHGGFTERQKQAFRRAADRWNRVILGGLSPVEVDGEVIRNILILAEAIEIDGRGRVLGQAGPTYLRPADAPWGALLPAKGEMQFDVADLARLEQDERLDDVVAHEMGHTLGLGTVWYQKELIQGLGTGNPTFVGAAAMREYALLSGRQGSVPVPVENVGGPGTADCHWRESIVGNELMSGVITGAKNPLSRLSVASLEDIGYVVDYAGVERYALPSIIARAERGSLAAVSDSGESVLPLVPSVLPSQALL